jgi:hypothetical protein
MARIKNSNQFIKKKENQKKEICYHIVNSVLAGGLIFFGTLLNGSLSWKGVAVALLASAIVAITKFKDYWECEKKEYEDGKSRIFSFIG